MIPADFPWRAGMLVRCSPSRDWIVTSVEGTIACLTEADSVWPKTWGYKDTDGVDLSDGWGPVLTDHATIGALAGAVRDAYREPFMFALPPGALSTLWTVHRNASSSPLGEPVAVGDTEGDAWLAAWNGRAK